MKFEFTKAVTEFLPLHYSKDKKTEYLAGLCALPEGSKIIGYQLPLPILKAMLPHKPARLLAVTSRESRELKKLALSGRHMISFEGELKDIHDRVFDTAVFRPISFLCEDLEPLIGQAQRLLRPGGTLIFLGDKQEKMYVSLITHTLQEAGFSQVRVLSDQDYSFLSCHKDEEQ